GEALVVFHMHEEEDDEGHLNEGNDQSHDGVESTQINIGNPGGERRAHQQGEEDADVGTHRNDVFGMFSMLLGHFLISSLGSGRQSSIRAGTGKSRRYPRSANTSR